MSVLDDSSDCTAGLVIVRFRDRSAPLTENVEIKQKVMPTSFKNI